MKFVFWIFLLLSCSVSLFTLPAGAQETAESKAELESLIKQVENSATPLSKVQNIYTLINYYRRQSNWEKADSLLKLGLSVAEKSEDKLAVVYAHMNYYTIFYTALSQEKRAEMTEQLETALKQSQKENFKNEEVLILSRLAYKYGFFDLNFEKAMAYFNKADLNDERVNDTARSDFYYHKSALHSRKKEDLEMFQLGLQALKYAEKSKSLYYRLRAYRVLGVYYKSLNEFEKAMSWHEKELSMLQETKNKKNINNVDFMIARCYRDWGKNDEAVKKYNTVIANSLEVDDRFNLDMSVAELYNLYLKLGKKIEAEALDTKFHLLEKMKLNKNYAFYHYMKGWYCSLFNADSARFHYNKAVLSADSLNDTPTELQSKSAIYTNLIVYFRKQGELQKAIATGQKALAVNNKLGLIANYPSIYENLDSAYQSAGDFKNAYAARRQYIFYKDSLDALNDRAESLRLETVAEEEAQKKKEEEELKATAKKHNIQYTAIAIGGLILLLTLLLMSFFHTPKWVIRVLTFVSFIFLFEFLILVLDTKIHHWAHGAPLPILLVKVLIACLLVPLHHWVEKKVLHFLHTKKLKVTAIQKTASVSEN